jgi:hypothetical protein
MPTEFAGLPSLVQKLLEQHQQHSQTLREIDATLARINLALGVQPAVVPAVKISAPTEKAAPAAKKASATGKVGGKVGAKRGRRSKFAVSGSDSVLAFVNAKKNPTTQEIKAHWISEGRAGGVDNTLSILTKKKKLKRTPLGKGIRGSRYSIA